MTSLSCKSLCRQHQKPICHGLPCSNNSPGVCVLQNAVPRRQAPPNDLFIPQFLPFDLSPAPPGTSSSPVSDHVGSQTAEPPASQLAYESRQETPWQATPRPADGTSGADLLSRHPFRLLPTAVFEQLSDPHLLNSEANMESYHVQATSQQQQQQHLGLAVRQNNENQIQAMLNDMQQKPVWMTASPGMKCNL